MSKLDEAISVIKAGNIERGKRLLVEVLKEDPNNAQAWLWMSGVVSDPERRRESLLAVLEIDPDNELAKKGLAKFGWTAPEPDPEPISVPPAPVDEDFFAPEDEDFFAPHDEDSFAPEDEDFFAPEDEDSFAPEDEDFFAPEDEDLFPALDEELEAPTATTLPVLESEVVAPAPAQPQVAQPRSRLFPLLVSLLLLALLAVVIVFFLTQ